MKAPINRAKIAPAMLFLLLIGGMHVSATPEMDEYSLRGKHIKFTIQYRYDNDLEQLNYKCMLENLDRFADSLKQSGRLSRGRIHFEILTAVWMYGAPGVEMYRYKNGYYCWLNGQEQPITQDYLLKIVAYFASDNWESFCYESGEMKAKRALQVFNRRIDTITVSYQHSSKKLLELNNLSVYFENGWFIGRGLDRGEVKITRFLPFSVGSKDVLFMDSAICVIENNAVLNSFKFNVKKFGPYELTGRAYDKKWAYFWVSADSYFLRYSIEKNRFYFDPEAYY